jgi:UDP-GlcNAc:undecaprenyl-phosphate/decaprenyl-phosphate GlcNAc-1-phosphate transferase
MEAAIGLGVSLALSAAFVHVPALRSLLLRSAVGARWRLDAVPVSGGIAMGAGFAAAIAWSMGQRTVAVVAAAGIVAILWGLLDDIATLRPMVKVTGQLAAAMVLVAGGVRFPLSSWVALEAVMTVVWVVAVANAVNLLDGMDGAAAGVAIVAAGTMWAWWATGSGDLPVVLPAALVGALGGFMAFNVGRARLFMGDSGATWLGVSLAALAVVDGGRLGGVTPAPPLLVLAVPAALLAVPLFDTMLVTIERRRHGRPTTVGGLDHTAHRLVAAGWTPGRAVALLWGLAAGAAGAATAYRPGVGWFIAAATALCVVLVVLGVALSRVDVYGERR